MITINTMYEVYTSNLNFKVIELQKRLETNTNRVQGLSNVLEKYREDINAYCSVKLDDILKVKTLTNLKAIKFPTYGIYSDGRKLNVKALLMYIKKYIEANKDLSTLTTNITRYKKEIISFKLYKRIISSFNLKIIDKIINNNYLFKLVPSFGGISVIRNHSKKKSVNWGASQKNKKAIIERGGIPYLKEDSIGVEDYKGEQWLVYHPSPNFYLHWHKTPNQLNIVNPYIKDYKYTPSRGKNSIVTKLQTVKDDREKALLLYTRTLNNE